MTRSYHQFCGVARALDVVGERWTLLIIRDLLPGPLRFSDLLELEEGIGPNLLTQRLKNLEAHGVLEIRTLPPPGRARVYALTELGMSLRDAVLALGRFGARWLTSPAAEDRIDPRWAMVSLKRRYLGSRRSWCVGLHVGELAFTVGIGGERAEVSDGAPRAPDLSLRGELPAYGALLIGGASARALVEQGRLLREGPARALADFARAFGLTP